MKSFRTEFEDHLVEADTLELKKKIYAFRNGSMDEEKFRSLRLARGVYGQHQPSVQMIRIKLPYGKVCSRQLLAICDVKIAISTKWPHTFLPVKSLPHIPSKNENRPQLADWLLEKNTGR